MVTSSTFLGSLSLQKNPPVQLNRWIKGVYVAKGPNGVGSNIIYNRSSIHISQQSTYFAKIAVLFAKKVVSFGKIIVKFAKLNFIYKNS